MGISERDTSGVKPLTLKRQTILTLVVPPQRAALLKEKETAQSRVR